MEKFSQPPLSFQINLIAPPRYVLSTVTLDRTEGIARLNSVIQVVRDSIEDSDGQFEIEMEVCVLLNHHLASFRSSLAKGSH